MFEKCHAMVNPRPFYKVGRVCRTGGARRWALGPKGGWMPATMPCLPTEVRVPGLQL